ncbi:MAG: hypothetical protein AAF798_08435 [Bacteroidota bacterium]
MWRFNPQNDLCANAIDITCDQTVTGSTVGAADVTVTVSIIFTLIDIDGPKHWYRFIGTGDNITVSLCGATDYNSLLLILTGDCGSQTLIAAADNGCSNNNLNEEIIDFATTMGTDYYIVVGGGGDPPRPSGNYELSVTCTPPSCAEEGDIFINELHYDNDGADVNEFVEVAVANDADLDLSDFTLTLYDGDNGEAYGTATLDQFAAGEDDGTFTYYTMMIGGFGVSGIQNGDPDGLALSCSEALVEFLSYEGTFDAVEGPAMGETSTDIGVSENDFSTSETASLQVINGTWTVTVCNTKGATNVNNPIPASPAIGVASKTVCQATDLSPGLLNTGISAPTILGTDEKIVWVVTAAPAASSYSEGDELTIDGCGQMIAFQNLGDFALTNNSQTLRVQDASSLAPGDYEFEAVTENCTTGCRSFPTMGFTITIEAAPAMPTADKLTAEFCATGEEGGSFNNARQVRVVQTGNMNEVFVWTLTDAPTGSQFDGMEPLEFLEDEVNSEFRITGGMQGDRVTLRQNAVGNATDPADNVYGTWTFEVRVRNTTLSCDSDPLTGFSLTALETPAEPVPATATKTICASADLTPSLANTGINISNSLSADEKVVWVLTGKPDGSAYAIDDEFTTDNCGDPFKNFGELAVANSSKVIRLQEVANAPEGTYTFDAFIENCMTGCTSTLVSGFSITVNAKPAVPMVNRLTKDACAGGTATVSVVDPGADFDVFWTVVAAPDNAVIEAGDVIGPGEETGEYRTNLETNGIRFRIKGNMMVVPGLYQLQASIVNTTTDCESELTTEVFEINIFEQPTVEITADLPMARMFVKVLKKAK